jgi:hypothetical protein
MMGRNELFGGTNDAENVECVDRMRVVAYNCSSYFRRTACW